MSRNEQYIRQIATLAAAAIVVSACASSGTRPAQHTPINIEIQESVGFTITEEARISNEVRLDYDRATMHLDRGELEQGIELLESIVDTAPGISAPRVDLGIAHHHAGNMQAAEEHLRTALEANPGHPIASNELGIIYRKTGRFAEARRSYEAALAIYPGYHYARRNLAVLCDLYLGDLECALRNYEAYMATVPVDDEVSMWMKDLQYRMSQAENGR
ncbi:MAG: tetratricopeptide repeat protein [Woeseiaceae bacterium]|nr:tetratricopeptide repeat protein [Woeseiaceae bacterium]